MSFRRIFMCDICRKEIHVDHAYVTFQGRKRGERGGRGNVLHCCIPCVQKLGISMEELWGKERGE